MNSKPKRERETEDNGNTLTHMPRTYIRFESVRSSPVNRKRKWDRKREGERKHIENADKMIFTYGVIKLSIINKMKIIWKNGNSKSFSYNSIMAT